MFKCRDGKLTLEKSFCAIINICRNTRPRGIGICLDTGFDFMIICLFYPVNRDKQRLVPKVTPGSCLVQQLGSAGPPPSEVQAGSSLSAHRKDNAIWLIEVLSFPQINETS